MLCVKKIIFLVAINCILASLSSVSAKDNKESTINCSIQRRCSTTEDIVWVTDNVQCFLFRNPCLFANEMCMRRAKKQEELKVVTKEECKKNCNNFCTDVFAPVCGEYDNAYKTFPNECEFYQHSCQNDQSYIFLQNGECDQAIEA